MTPEPISWRVELHLSGVLTDEQRYAIIANRDTNSVGGDHGAQLVVIVHTVEATLPIVPLMNALAIVTAHAPQLTLNAVQITKAMSEQEAVAWIQEQFKANSVSWKSNLNF